MIDTEQPDTSIDQALTEAATTFAKPTTEAWRAHEQREALDQYVRRHLSDEGIERAVAPGQIALGTTEHVDPMYFQVIGNARFAEPSADERSKGIQVSEVFQPKTELERQIESLTAAQQIEVVAGIGQHMVAIRAYKLGALSTQSRR